MILHTMSFKLPVLKDFDIDNAMHSCICQAAGTSRYMKYTVYFVQSEWTDKKAES